MATKSETLWIDCQAAVKGHCSKSGKASAAITVTTPGKFQGQVVCAGCAKHLKLKRSSAISATDTVSQRQGQTKGDALGHLTKGDHKVLYTRGGHVKGGTPQLTDAEVAKARGVKAPAVKAPAVKAPAKVAKAGKKRKPAKVA